MLLEISGLCTFYGRVAVLKQVSMHVQQGEIVALLGANGAGKTTLLRAISGIVPIAEGHILFEGSSLINVLPHSHAKLGIAHAPEGRQIFNSLSVEENLRLGAYWRRDSEILGDMRDIYDLFPILRAKSKQMASELSGGQQQMLAIGRALMAAPRLLLLDEPSLGLAPLLIEQIFSIIASLRDRGVTILLVEQNASAALSIADRGYVLETGKIVHDDTGAALLANPAVRQAYLGI